MGFNPRLAPHTFSVDFNPFGIDTSTTKDQLLFKFPFAGQILGARFSTLDTIAADSTTGISVLALWKFATDDVTATYAAGLVSAAMTDAITGGTATARTEKVDYALTNSSTASRLHYNAGDRVMLRSTFRHTSGGSRLIHLQVEYMHGHENA